MKISERVVVHGRRKDYCRWKPLTVIRSDEKVIEAYLGKAR